MKTLFSRGGHSFVVTGGSSQSGDCAEEEEDDILNLCSGRFTGIRAGGSVKEASKDGGPSRHLGLFSHDDGSNDSDSLLQVLSGEFTKCAGGEDGVKSKDSVSAMRDNKVKRVGESETRKGGEMAEDR